MTIHTDATATPDVSAMLAQMQAMQAQIAEQAAKIERMKVASQRKLTMKLTEKGGLSIYGMGRFPVTLYRGQWERLLEAKTDILQFISDNSEHLKVKGEAVE